MTEGHELPWDMHSADLEYWRASDTDEREWTGTDYLIANEADQDLRRYLEAHGLAAHLVNDAYTAYVALTVAKFFVEEAERAGWAVEGVFEEEEDEEGLEVASVTIGRTALPLNAAMQRLLWAASRHAFPDSDEPEPFGASVDMDSLAHLDFEFEEVGEEEE